MNDEQVQLAVPIVEEVHSNITIRPLSVEEGLRRIRQRAELAKLAQVPTESPEDKHAREAREADVVEAARRSQAEIRRHIDSYLKEYFETIAADVASVVVKQVHERILKGVAAMQEVQQIELDRMAASVRAQLRAFMRRAWQDQPIPRARRAPPKGARKHAQTKR